ncbi:unnamed protein product [Auanema sp. JU1783]|nr:unnamed protein product [Auanema sp. JU1783]
MNTPFPLPIVSNYQNEGKKVNDALVVIEQKVTDAKKIVEELLFMLDLQEKVPWPDMLEKFSAIAAAYTQLQALIKKSGILAGHEDHGALLRSHVMVPQRLQLETDDDLVNLTNHRMYSFNHDNVPDYLKTRYTPDMENEEFAIEQERTTKTNELANRQIQNLNKHVDMLLVSLPAADKANYENLMEKPSHNMEDTVKLVRAIMCGEGLRQTPVVRAAAQAPPSRQGGQASGMSNNIARNRGGSSRCDFFGVEPRVPSPAPSERRSSQLTGINLSLQALIDEFRNRPRPTVGIEDNPSVLCSTTNGPKPYIDLAPIGCNDGEVEHITVLFPWMQVSVICNTEMTLYRLKNELFSRLRNMEVSSFSMEPSNYLFRAVRQSTGQLDILYNEDSELYKLDLTTPFPFLFLFEPEGAKRERKLAKGVERALGRSLTMLEGDLTDELKAFRASLWKDISESVKNRGNGGVDHYAFPEEDYLGTKEAQASLTLRMNSKPKYIVFYRSREDEELGIDENSVSVEVPYADDLYSKDLIDRVLEQFQEIGQKCDDEEYILQIAGRKTYITEDRRLLASRWLRSNLSNYVNPVLVLRRKSIVLRNYLEPLPLQKPHYVHAEEVKAEVETKEPLPSLWTVDENLLIRPTTYSNMGGHHDMNSSIVVLFTFYMGSVVMAEVVSKSISPRNPRWLDPAIHTGIYMKDVPEAMILTIEVFELRRSKKTNDTSKKNDSDPKKTNSEINLLALLKDEDGKGRKYKDNEDRISASRIGWVNMPMYDWNGDMQLGTFTVALWTTDFEPPPNGRIGTMDTKLHGRSAVHCRLTFETTTTITSREAGRRSCRIVDDCRWKELYNVHFKNDVYQYVPERDDESLEKIKGFLEKRYVGTSLMEEEQQFVWDKRDLVSNHMPDAILLIMESRYMWETRESFGYIYTKLLYGQWGSLSLPAAITILSTKCSDRIIRKFAAQQLDESLSDHDLSLFILPIIQSLKCETRADSDVARLLVKRALSDYRLGHKCFWLLRAELIGLHGGVSGHLNQVMYKRFAILIEAFIRGNEEHMETILKQIEMVEFLSKVSSVVKNYKDRDAATKRLQQELEDNRALVEHIDSPLDPTDVLGELIIEKCKVLGSAKIPIRLSWRNANPLSEHYLPLREIIFKNGDDLRQDMLVLQVLVIMDAIWKRNNLDFCLSPYPVLPTGIKVGMIGVVPNCSTIFEIQSEGGKMGTAVKSLETTFLNKYVRNNSHDSTSYLESVDRFMLSCVGYSVATFVMGIRDRHNDNLMVTKDGKLLHIDFGHILGHGKTKLGIQRDRVPFVLTEHFLCLISKGNPVPKSAHEIEKFQTFCTEAFLYLYEERLLFSSLFTAMKSMELPELSTESDVDHIKKSLRVDNPDRDEARKYFGEIFDEAFNGSWATKTNWFFHTVKHL